MSPWNEDILARVFGLECAVREAHDLARDIAEQYNPDAQFVGGDLHEGLARLKFLFEQIDRKPSEAKKPSGLVATGPRKKNHSGLRE